MITPKHIMNSVEIRFWRMAIPLMEESSIVQNLVTTGYKAREQYRPLPSALKTMVWALLGWIFGLAVGLISLLLF